MDNLRLFIVAGPNGSGKSLLSSKLTESDYTVFDVDKHVTEFAKKYPEIVSDVLSNAVNEQVFKVEKLYGDCLQVFR
jgi:dephospho-CoA kinase